MLESGWMLLAAWLVFGQLAGFRYARYMVFRLYTKYLTHYEVVVNQQRYWFNDVYWIVNSMMYYGLFTFFAIFAYGVFSTILGLSSTGGWYVAYITLFLSIWYRARDTSKDAVYKKSCDRIDVLLDAKGYTVNLSELHADKDSMTRKQWAAQAALKKNAKSSPTNTQSKVQPQ